MKYARRIKQYCELKGIGGERFLASIGYLPTGILAKLLEESHKEGRPVLQLELELIRKALKDVYGWECDHEKHMRYDKKNDLHRCRGCGQLFYKARVLGESKYVPIPETWRVSEVDFGLLRPDLRRSDF